MFYKEVDKIQWNVWSCGMAFLKYVLPLFNRLKWPDFPWSVTLPHFGNKQAHLLRAYSFGHFIYLLDFCYGPLPLATCLNVLHGLCGKAKAMLILPILPLHSGTFSSETWYPSFGNWKLPQGDSQYKIYIKNAIKNNQIQLNPLKNNKNHIKNSNLEY